MNCPRCQTTVAMTGPVCMFCGHDTRLPLHDIACGDCDPCCGGRPDQCAVMSASALSASPAVEAVKPLAPVLDEPAVPFALGKSQALREYEACQLIMSRLIAEGKHSTASFRVLWALSEQIKNANGGHVPAE